MKKAKEPPQHLTKGIAEPPQIHHDHDETLLAGLTKKGLEKGAGFWIGLITVGAAALGVVWAVNSLANRPPAGSEAWGELIAPASVSVPAEDPRYQDFPTSARVYLKIADDHPDSTAAPWAILSAAATCYSEGMRDLPNRRETARQALRQSVELYDRVLKLTRAGSTEILEAMLGKARAQESSGELADAIASYDLIATKYPGSSEAKLAEQRSKDLQDPEVKSFYNDFYTRNFSSLGSLPGGLTPFGSGTGGTPDDLLKNLPGLLNQPGGSGLLNPPAATDPGVKPGDVETPKPEAAAPAETAPPASAEQPAPAPAPSSTPEAQPPGEPAPAAPEAEKV